MAEKISALRTMLAKDVISAKLASAYITIDGNRYLLFQAKKIKLKFEKTKKEVGILGRLQTGHKATGGNGTGSMTIYQNTDLFTQMLIEYIHTGRDIYFDMQISNFDPTSDAGRQTIIVKGCNINGADLASADADGDWLEQDIDFTWEDVQMPESFKLLDGMK